jgi:hypothetical protein
MLMAMDATTMIRERRVPVGPGKMRKTLTLPKELVARVRAFRHAHQFDRESDAYAELLKAGLDAFEGEQQDREPKQRQS